MEVIGSAMEYNLEQLQKVHKHYMLIWLCHHQMEVYKVQFKKYKICYWFECTAQYPFYLYTQS